MSLLKRTVSWGTTPMLLRSDSCVTWKIECPSTEFFMLKIFNVLKILKELKGWKKLMLYWEYFQVGTWKIKKSMNIFMLAIIDIYIYMNYVYFWMVTSYTHTYTHVQIYQKWTKCLRLLIKVDDWIYRT